jgi:integrase
VSAYGHAIRDACDRAGVTPWHPHQLRHALASRIRREHGLEAAEVILGHARADVMQVYAARDESRAREVIRSVG